MKPKNQMNEIVYVRAHIYVFVFLCACAYVFDHGWVKYSHLLYYLYMYIYIWQHTSNDWVRVGMAPQIISKFAKGDKESIYLLQ